MFRRNSDTRDAFALIANQQNEIHSSVKSIAESTARTASDVSALREEFHVSKEQMGQRLTVVELWQSGATTWIRWLIPLFAGGGLLGGGYFATHTQPSPPQVIAVPMNSTPIPDTRPDRPKE